MRYLFLVVAFIFSNFYSLKADDVNITTLLDKSEISKNYLFFKIKIEQPPKIFVNIENWEQKTEYIQIIGKTKSDTTRKEQNIIVQHIYRIFVPDNDTFEIPQININYTIGERNFYKNTKPIKLCAGDIKKINLDEKFKPIKKNQKLPINFMEILPFLIGFLIFILLILLVIFFIKKSKKNKTFIKTEKPKLPPHVIAFDKLKKLENQKLWQNEQTKKYHIILTEILKEYIENRFDILALEQTTNDLIDELERVYIKQELIEIVQKTLNLSDLVKFAKMKPVPEDNKMCFDNIYKFIEQTKETFKEKE